MPHALSEQLFNGLPQRGQSQPSQISGRNAQRGQNRRSQICWSRWPFNRSLGAPVGGTDDPTSLHASARDQRRIAIVPVIAARLVVDFRRAPEFANRDNQRRTQQSALVEV